MISVEQAIDSGARIPLNVLLFAQWLESRGLTAGAYKNQGVDSSDDPKYGPVQPDWWTVQVSIPAEDVTAELESALSDNKFHHTGGSSTRVYEYDP